MGPVKKVLEKLTQALGLRPRVLVPIPVRVPKVVRRSRR